MKKINLFAPKVGAQNKKIVFFMLASSFVLLFAGCRGCNAVHEPDLVTPPDGRISEGTYNADNNNLKLRMQRQMPNDLLIKDADTTYGGYISVDKVKAMIENMPAGSKMQYKFAIDPATKKLVLMMKGGDYQGAPLIYRNDQFCPRMCD